jgi:hypothetical protein
MKMGSQKWKLLALGTDEITSQVGHGYSALDAAPGELREGCEKQRAGLAHQVLTKPVSQKLAKGGVVEF